MSRPSKTPARLALTLMAATFLVLTTGCNEVTPEAAETLPAATPTVTVTVAPTVEPTDTATGPSFRSAISSGLWSTAQTCAALEADAEDLSMILSFMEAEPPDMDHVLAAEAVATDFLELGEGTEGPVREHLIDLSTEVLALVAELWEAGEAGEGWVMADQLFDLGPFDAAVAGLGEDCPPPAP